MSSAERPAQAEGPPSLLLTTARQAFGRLLRFLKWFVPITLVFALARLSTGGVDLPQGNGSDLLVVLGAFLLSLYAGAFAYSAIVGVSGKPSYRRYLSAWSAAGALTMILLVAIVVVVDWSTQQDEAIFRSVWFWLGVALCGGVVGYAYGRVAGELTGQR